MRLLVAVEKARLKVWADFATQEECVQLIELARPRLNRSTVLDLASGGSIVMDARTSQGAAFRKDEFPLIEQITTRAAQMLNESRDRIEPLQIIRYGIGDRYDPHNDWFDPNDSGSFPALTQGGQRTKTLLLYLNTPDAGGDTNFPEAGVRVNAIGGSAAQFEYPSASVADMCLHGGSPVIGGEKWAVNVWVRERVVENAELGVKVVNGVLLPSDCAMLRHHYDKREAEAENGVDHVLRFTNDDPFIAPFVALVATHMRMIFDEPMTVETVLLARLPAGVVMENHADNTRWDGTKYVANHTPDRTHTAVVFLQTGSGGVTHYGDNVGAANNYAVDVGQQEGRMHAHRCGPDYHHRVSASDAPRYTFAIWFK